LLETAENTHQVTQENDVVRDVQVPRVVACNGHQLPHGQHQIEDAQDNESWVDPRLAEEEFDWYEEYQKFEAMNNTRMFSESDPEDVSQSRDAFVPTSPVALPAPFGSGRKGKDKSHEEYAAAASTLGWGGSYNSYANGDPRRGGSEEDGNNSGPGRGLDGAGGGGGGGDRITNEKGARNTQRHDDAFIAQPAI
jgi:hypothetical protein